MNFKLPLSLPSNANSLVILQSFKSLFSLHGLLQRRLCFFSVLLSIKRGQAIGLKVFTDSSHVKFELTSDDKKEWREYTFFLSVVHPYPPMAHLT
jgi:hypothetical protein